MDSRPKAALLKLPLSIYAGFINRFLLGFKSRVNLVINLAKIVGTTYFEALVPRLNLGLNLF